VRNAIAAGGIPLAEPTSWPEFHDLLGAVLAAPPQDRPSAAELAALLRKLTP
jgi:hypothetical protein